MSERARMIAMVAGVLGLAGAGAYYFFGVYRPHQVRRDAQAEITRWEARWSDARACLLGPTPASSKTSEALAVRELSPDPWDRGSCTAKIGRLSRAPGPSSGLDRVEHAWETLDHAAGQAAEAYAVHVSGAAASTGPDPLPAALDALDAARQALRTAAGLPSDEAHAHPLPAARLVPITDAGEPLTDLALDALPSAHGCVAFGKTASRSVQVTLVPGQAPSVARVGAGAIRAVPDASWGATLLGQVPNIGALDRDGGMASPLALEPVATSPDAEVALAAVIGAAGSGVVVYGGKGQLAIARLQAGKPVTTRRAMDFALANSDPDGRAAVVWSTGDHGATLGELVAPGQPDAPVALPGAVSGLPCVAGDRAWVAAGGHLVGFARDVFDGGELDGQLVGCTHEGALVHLLVDPRSYAACTPSCHAFRLPAGAPDDAAVALVGGQLVAVALHGGVAGVWRADGTKQFYALPRSARLAGAQAGASIGLTDGKRVDVLARDDDGYAVVRLPVTPGP